MVDTATIVQYVLTVLRELEQEGILSEATCLCWQTACCVSYRWEIPWARDHVRTRILPLLPAGMELSIGTR